MLVLFVVGLILALIGWWTVAHPNGGYRAVGGAGSGLAPGTRRVAGFALIAVAVLMVVIGGAGAAR